MDINDVGLEPPLGEPEPDEASGRSGRSIAWLAGAAVGLAGFAAFWFYGRGADEPEPAAEPAAAVAAPEAAPDEPEPPPAVPAPPEPPPPPPVELPALDESDSVVRNLAAALSAHPDLAAWLVGDRMIRRFVVAVDNVANGRNPAEHLPFMRPEGRFDVIGEPPDLRIDPRSHQRYDLHAGIVASLDTSGAAALYARLEPLMDEAYAELGYPGTPFRTALERAVVHLLAAPIVEDPPVLPGMVFYEHTDPRLRSLTPAQQQLLGMGPENVRRVRAKMRAIAAEIGVAAGR